MPTISESISTFLVKFAEVKSPNTARTYKFALARFRDHLLKGGINGERKTTVLNIDHFVDFVSYMARSDMKRSSWATYVAGASAYLKYLRTNELINVTERDMAKLQDAIKPIKKSHRRLPQSPSDDTLNKMRVQAATMGNDLAKLRNVALVEFLASTGCRVDEVHKLKVSDVDFSQHRVRVIGKGDKERLVFPSQVACDRLSAYFNERKASLDAPVFTAHVMGKPNKTPLTTRGMWSIVNSISVKSGVGRFHPHLFRHYFGTVMLDKTDNLALVQDLMGHSSPATTRVYADVAVSKRQEAVRSVFG